MTVDIAFLYCPKQTPLREITGTLGMNQERVLNILEDLGIYTYGQLLSYAKDNDFSDLPGIGAHIAERIRQVIEFGENGNKNSLIAMFRKLDDRFPSLRGVVQEQIRLLKIQNGLLHDYS